MSEYQTLLLAADGPVWALTINRPDKLNALNRLVLEELLDVVRAAERSADVRAIVVTGAGEKAFVAGADIAEMASLGPAEARAFSELGHRVMDGLGSLSAATIAAVNGFALGGGCELALGCDLIVASDRAKFGQPEVNLGVIPGFGGTQRLAERVGIGKTREIVFTGATIGAEEALRIGLADRVVPAAELASAAKALATEIAAKGPVAIATAKRVIGRGSEAEKEGFAMLFGTADQKEGMRAFAEKRKPAFTGC